MTLALTAHHLADGHVFEQWMRKHAKIVKPKVNAQEKARYRNMFDLLDEDKSGSLDFDELYEAVRYTGLKMTRSELLFIIKGSESRLHLLRVLFVLLC